jgi:biotin transport system substrate-specific component
MRFSARELVYTALFAVLIALCAWISVPTAVPFTLQTFGVFAALTMLGGRRGFFAVLCYVLLGAAGLPVFSGFRGGAGMLFGSTGGYIFVFLLCRRGLLLSDGSRPRFFVGLCAMALWLALCYFFGTRLGSWPRPTPKIQADHRGRGPGLVASAVPSSRMNR